MTEPDKQRFRAIDQRILAALRERFQLARELVDANEPEAYAPPSPDQDTAYLRELLARGGTSVPAPTLEAVFREILAGVHSICRPRHIAVLGPFGTFTHQAAEACFGATADYRPQPTVADVFEAVARDQADYGVVPVENSTEGAVNFTLDMFVDTPLRICGELNLPIHHSLVSGTSPSAITVLYSHPQVFAQCRHWLLTHLPGIPLVETASTADAAARCLREPTAGALAGTMAAEHFGVPIQVPNIEDFGDNITRFLILGHRDAPPTGDDKTSVLFVVRDRVGALYDCLRPFEECGVSMTMIESRPSRRRNWDYHFFVDFLGHVQDPGVVDVLEQLSEHCQTMKVLGSYPRGLQPHVRGRNGESDGIRPADR